MNTAAGDSLYGDSSVNYEAGTVRGVRGMGRLMVTVQRKILLRKETLIQHLYRHRPRDIDGAEAAKQILALRNLLIVFHISHQDRAAGVNAVHPGI